MEDREISREEAIKRLEKGEPFNELYDPLWEAALALAIKALKAEPVKQERCEFCKDGKTFWGAELILDNEGNWHNIEYCPICGAKMNAESKKMPKLIDANEIIRSEHQHYDYMADEYYVPVRDIKNAPPVDAVPVVRCKDCKKYIPCQKLPIGTSKWCDLFDRATCEMNYCGWAEMREEPEINPCRGCEDYDGKGGCKSRGGCGERREDE